MESMIKALIILISTIVLVVLTCGMTIWASGNYWSQCSAHHADDKPLNPKGGVWDLTEVQKNEEKNVKIIRTVLSKRCYISPLDAPVNVEQGNQFHIIRQQLSEERLAHLAGLTAVDFCRGYSAFELAKESPLPNRRKRGLNPNECQDSVIIECPETVQESCTSGPGTSAYNGGMYKIVTKCVNSTTFTATITDRCKEVDATKEMRRVKCFDAFYREAAAVLSKAGQGKK